MPQNSFDLIVVGGGASGFFAALQAAEMDSSLRIAILEKSSKLLSKVRVSGGGRCNVTHHCFDPIKLSKHYPRGEKTLKSLFKRYHAQHVVDWFSSKGVKLKAEEDGRMFPVTDDSQTIIDCFLREAEKHRIVIHNLTSVKALEKRADGTVWDVKTENGSNYIARAVVVAIGGHPNKKAYSFLQPLGHSIISPVPSLFTFNDPAKGFADLMGLSVPDATVKIIGTKYASTGPLLITHWGLSGPAVIRLSAWAAEYLHQVQYSFNVLVSWIGDVKEEELRQSLALHKSKHPKQKVLSNPLFSMPQRLWLRLCERAEIPTDKIWSELSNKNLNKLIEFLIRCPFAMEGKTTFKEEFVTCGGVPLEEVNVERMESKKMQGLFFAGEVLNIDGETGGFNFQAAWSTAYVTARAITASE